MALLNNEFEFYSKFVRPLILALPDATDRIAAAAWAKKLNNTKCGDEKLRTNYMKLLLFALQKKKIVGIFSDDPENYDYLPEFPAEYNLNAIAKEMIEKEQMRKLNKIRKQRNGQYKELLTYTTDFSSDLREYVAAQDIPNFGIHCYYAISKHPFTTWNKPGNKILP